MGLDVSGGTESFRAGSYSGFHAWRNWLAEKMGYKSYDEYSNLTQDLVGEMTGNGIYKDASSIKLGAIMWHSDCDGIIPNKEIPKLLTDLKELQKEINKENDMPMIEDSEVNMTEEQWNENLITQWIRMCESAIETNDNISFH